MDIIIKTGHDIEVIQKAVQYYTSTLNTCLSLPTIIMSFSTRQEQA
jgi:hypothetical protein